MRLPEWKLPEGPTGDELIARKSGRKNPKYDRQRQDRSQSSALGAYRQGVRTLGAVLRQAFSEIATTPFQAVQADLPAGMTAAQYTLLSEYDLSPAPGYYSALFHELPNGQIIESAKRHAAMQAELGNTEVFIAAGVGGIREWTAPQ